MFEFRSQYTPILNENDASQLHGKSNVTNHSINYSALKLTESLPVVVTVDEKHSRLSSMTVLLKQNIFLVIMTFITIIFGIATIYTDTSSNNVNSLDLLMVRHNSYTNTYEVIDTANKYESQIKYNVDGDDFRYSDFIIASGSYEFNVNGNGWHHLTVTVPDFPQQLGSAGTTAMYLRSMEAIGLLEGYATCNEIKQYYVNFYSGLFDGGDPKPETVEFLRDNLFWMEEQANMNYKHSEYWLTVKGLINQLYGVLEGIKRNCPGTLTVDDDYNDDAIHGVHIQNLDKRPALLHLLLLNANGDLYQIAAKYDQQNAPPSVDDDYDDDSVGFISSTRSNTNIPQYSSRKKYNTGIDPMKSTGSRETGVDHCSVIIKLLDDKSDVFFAHNTWDDFQALSPRIFKHYSYPILSPFSKQNGRLDMHFSSSPGFITSVDDFFIVKGKANLFVTETTIDLYNVELLKLIEPTSMLSWARSRLSNQLADNGSDWVNIFSRFHSGTYDNQWMVIDIDKFEPFNDPLPGFLHVVEEIPGYVEHGDLTSHLISNGYWASYNNPYFDSIQELSGNAEYCKLNDNYCHEGDPRAKIFKERQSSVTDMKSLQLLMGYNRWQIDPLSLNDSCNAIACRQDLEPVHSGQYPFGATDAKASSVMNAKQEPVPNIYARLGPTHDDQEPFCWSHFDDQHRNTRGRKFSHLGHPPCFEFDWELMPPRSYY